MMRPALVQLVPLMAASLPGTIALGTRTALPKVQSCYRIGLNSSFSPDRSISKTS